VVQEASFLVGSTDGVAFQVCLPLASFHGQSLGRGVNLKKKISCIWLQQNLFTFHVCLFVCFVFVCRWGKPANDFSSSLRGGGKNWPLISTDLNKGTCV